MFKALRHHWPEYLMEAWGLGTFMVAAGLAATLLEFPGSPVREAIPDPLVRRALMGLAMGLTAIGIIYSPWGKRSGAHINPAVTLTFFGLGKIAAWDALFYVLFQVAGGTLGVLLVVATLGRNFTSPPVSFLVTVPGPAGAWAALAAEAFMAGLLMVMVLFTTNRRSWMPWTGALAGVLLFLFITLEAPLSGMSINPARSLASAVPSGIWSAWWVYMVGPCLGMVAAALLYVRAGQDTAVHCAKLNHTSEHRCIFCEFQHHRAHRAGADQHPEREIP